MDNLIILNWWTTIFLVGLIFLPLTLNLFSNFIDRGYIFSKIIGIAVISYTVFVLGILKLTPFTFMTIFVTASVFLILNLALFRKSLIKIISKKWPVFIFEEIIFLLGLLFWSFIKSYQPDIHGLEKYMDFGFMNSILRSEYFPPRDMWFTPYSINYYYFGHLATAVLTKLSSIPSNITFNLMLSSLFAFTFTSSFSIGANLVHFLFLKRGETRLEGMPTTRVSTNVRGTLMGGKVGARPRAISLLGGFLTAFLVSFAGNLQVIYAFFKPYQNENPLPFWQLPFLPQTFPNSYWYSNATRFIYNTIHEFPIYSFVVSDLHGHVLDIPFVLLTIAVLFSILLKSQAPNHKSQINSKNQISKPLGFINWNLFATWRLNFRNLLLIGFLLAVMYMTNVWDGLIYLFLSIFVIFYINLKSHIPLNYRQDIKYQVSGIMQYKNHILHTVYCILIVLVGFFLFSLPFSLNFKPFASGIGILCSPQFLIEKERLGPFLFEQKACQKSPFWQLMLLYGFFYFWIIMFLSTFVKKENYKSKITSVSSSKEGKANYNWKSKIGNLAASDIFILLLIILSTILIIIPEFIYIKDIYPKHYRANTMFKLVYQSFIMLSIVSGYIIIHSISNFKFQISNFKYYGRPAVFGIGVILLALVFLYPQFAIESYYNNFQTKSGLDGTKYLKSLYPNDYEAIIWINKNIKNQPVILEAHGDSYTDFGRFSANTGLPTVLGWTVHEWLWRGTYDIPAPRISEIKNLYETQDLTITKQLINKYKISYVIIGVLERQKYSNLNESKFKELGKLVYQNGTTKIYKIN